MTDDAESTTERIVSKVPDDLMGEIVKLAVTGSIGNIQDELRFVGERFILRNDFFTAKVQSNRRITIPEAAAEKLGIEKGDLVQFMITPVPPQNEEEE